MGEIYSKSRKNDGSGVCHLCGDRYFRNIRSHIIRSEEHKKRLAYWREFGAFPPDDFGQDRDPRQKTLEVFR